MNERHPTSAFERWPCTRSMGLCACTRCHGLDVKRVFESTLSKNLEQKWLRSVVDGRAATTAALFFFFEGILNVKSFVSDDTVCFCVCDFFSPSASFVFYFRNMMSDSLDVAFVP